MTYHFNKYSMSSENGTRPYLTIGFQAKGMRMAIPIATPSWSLVIRSTQETQGYSTSDLTIQMCSDQGQEKERSTTSVRTEMSSPTPSLPTTPELQEIHGLPLSPPPLPKRSSSNEYEPATQEIGSYNGIVSSPTLGRSTLYGSPIQPSGLPSTMRPSYFTLGEPSISIDRDPNDPKRSIWSVHPGAEKHPGQGL